jgi:hypothetical protein
MPENESMSIGDEETAREPRRLFAIWLTPENEELC